MPRRPGSQRRGSPRRRVRVARPLARRAPSSPSRAASHVSFEIHDGAATTTVACALCAPSRPQSDRTAWVARWFGGRTASRPKCRRSRHVPNPQIPRSGHTARGRHEPQGRAWGSIVRALPWLGWQIGAQPLTQLCADESRPCLARSPRRIARAGTSPKAGHGAHALAVVAAVMTRLGARRDR